ncbi:MAG: small multi-drug export protein [Bacillota bacterium]|nr:small multi-drug export protein [Bacillota bacterium]MDW7684658.1 small multi-drug export protein [Bacillota bacterium]
MTYLKVFLLSALPVVEIRGGVPLGIYLGLSGWEALAVSVLGNVMIILPWLWVLARLEVFFAQHKLTAPFYGVMVRKAEKKRDSFMKYGKYALFLFVAIPLPTTGAWTACVAARIFRVSTRDTFWIVSLGVIVSGLLVLAKVTLWTGTFI